jgi:hypothetical protein
MATAQTSADKKSAGLITQEDAGGFVYTMIGNIQMYTGTGAPNHTASKGSLYIDTASGKPYINTDAGTTWALIGTIES